MLRQAGLPVDPGSSDEVRLLALAAKADKLTGNALATSTQRAYTCNIRRVAQVHPDLLPMDNLGKVKIYFSSLAGMKWHRVQAVRCSVSAMHRFHEWAPPPLDSPLLKDFWRGLKKSCDNKVSGKQPILPEHLKAMLTHWVRYTSRACRARIARPHPQDRHMRAPHTATHRRGPDRTSPPYATHTWRQCSSTACAASPRSCSCVTRTWYVALVGFTRPGPRSVYTLSWPSLLTPRVSAYDRSYNRRSRTQPAVSPWRSASKKMTLSVRE